MNVLPDELANNCTRLTAVFLSLVLLIVFYDLMFFMCIFGIDSVLVLFWFVVILAPQLLNKILNNELGC